MASPSATQATRRRQRSTRVSVSIGLIALAALVVIGAATSGSWLLTTVDSRVLASRDRAAQAQAFNQLNDQRTTEHAAQVAELTARIAEKEEALDQLEGALASSQRRAATSTRKHNAEMRRSAGLQVRLDDAEDRAGTLGLQVTELEQEVVALRAELESVTAAWHAAEHMRRHA
jgi:chromosome segregation ATPase